MTEDSDEQTFWMVAGDGPTSHRHLDLMDAIKEAERLSKLNPGQSFFVMQAHCVAFTPLAKTTVRGLARRESVVPF